MLGDQSSESASIEDIPDLRLVAYRIDVDSDGRPDLFTVEVNGDRPLVSDGSILFFLESGHADFARTRDDDPAVRAALLTSMELEYVHDVPTALSQPVNSERDDGARILGCLNALLDMLRSLGDAWLVPVKASLYPLASHLTIHEEFGEIFDQIDGGRAAVYDNILWALGDVMTHATIVRPSFQGE